MLENCADKIFICYKFSSLKRWYSGKNKLLKRLYVFADFDWLKELRLIGGVSYELLRDFDNYS